jgi:hypothetical protein
MISRTLGAFAALLTLIVPSLARAERTAEERAAIADDDRPHTLAQLGLGLLTIPGADVCLKDKPCTKGDTSIAMEFWQMYRANRYFAVGAGASVAIKPTVDYPPNLGGIERSHTRSYFTVEAQARYYALRLDVAEAWVGLSGGGVVVSDRYTIEDSTNTFGSGDHRPAPEHGTNRGADAGRGPGRPVDPRPELGARRDVPLRAMVLAEQGRDDVVSRQGDADQLAGRALPRDHGSVPDSFVALQRPPHDDPREHRRDPVEQQRGEDEQRERARSREAGVHLRRRGGARDERDRDLEHD